MRNFKIVLPKKTSREVCGQNIQDIPKLFRTYNKRQLFEVLIGLVTLFVRGIGGIILIASLLDLYVFSYVYKVRNMQTGETFLMDKPEWKKYRSLVKKTK